MKMLIILGLVLLLAVAALADGMFNAKDYGAIGDGLADDTAAIQAALDAAGQVSGVACLPTGKYRITAALNVPAHTTLLGEGDRWENTSVRLIVEQPGYSAVVLNHVSSVKGLTISYPNNQDNSAPVAYPPAILLAGINPSAENIVFDAAWIGVSTGEFATNTGQALFRNLTGFVHSVGIHLDGIADIVRIENVHWFVGGDDSKGNWYRDNRVGFEFGRVDGVIMDKCFMIGGKTFVHQLPVSVLPDNPEAPAHSLPLMFTQCWVENVQFGFIFEGRCGFTISDSQILINNNEGCGIKVDCPSVYYGAFINDVQIRPMPYVVNPGIYVSFSEPHPRNQVSISNCQVVGGAPSIHLGPGAARVLVTNSHLSGAGQPAVLIDEGADLFQIRGNIIAAEEPIRDLSSAEARKIFADNLVED